MCISNDVYKSKASEYMPANTAMPVSTVMPMFLTIVRQEYTYENMAECELLVLE